MQRITVGVGCGMALHHELAVALRTATAAADIVYEVYGRDYTVRDKGQDDPVTDADRRSNDYIIGALKTAFPADAICDEEGQLEAASVAASRGGRCWFVDPLDGTREFIAKSGEFAVMIGLAIDGRPRLGVICAPVWRRTFVGLCSDSAYELDAAGNSRPLRVNHVPPASIESARLVLSRRHRNAQVDAAADRLGIRDIRICGSTGLKMMLVASGEVDLFNAHRLRSQLVGWLRPAGHRHAAGGTVCDAMGKPLRYDTAELPLRRGIVAGEEALVRRAVDALVSTAG